MLMAMHDERECKTKQLAKENKMPKKKIYIKIEFDKNGDKTTGIHTNINCCAADLVLGFLALASKIQHEYVNQYIGIVESYIDLHNLVNDIEEKKGSKDENND